MRLFLAGLGLSMAVASSAGAITVGGFDTTRTLSSSYSIYGANAANAELTDPGNAAGYGDTVTMAAGIASVTASYLAGVDIFFTGLVWDSKALSAGEVTALTDFINSGGVVIGYGDNLGFDSTLDVLLNNFGLDVDNTANNGPLTTMTVSAPGNPLVDGPFGTVSSISISDSAYLNAASGDGVNVMSYSGGQGGVGFVGPDGTRAGALIFLPDSETFGLGGSLPGFRDQAGASILFNNAVAYAVSLDGGPAPVPVPPGLALAATGLVVLGGMRRRKQRG